VITVLSESEPIARKQHNCMACEFILNCGVNGFGYTFAELRLIAKAKRNNYNVVKGQKYIRQNNICDGEIYTFKAIPEMHELCLKHDLYDH
tara:strand:+ start:644 stop:916 length:273 start_codon:yes stop_codon:yes gene_type:complete